MYVSVRLSIQLINHTATEVHVNVVEYQMLLERQMHRLLALLSDKEPLQVCGIFFLTK